MLGPAEVSRTTTDLSGTKWFASRAKVGMPWRHLVAAGLITVLLVGLLALAGRFDTVRSDVARGSYAASKLREPAVLVASRERASLARLRRSALEQKAWRHWLDSPVAQRQRVASRIAFHGLAAGASQLLLMRDYGSVLTEASANPAARIGHVVRYLSDDRVVVRTAHGLELKTSTVPLRVADGDGGKRPVDLRLVERGGRFVPLRPLTDMSIARDSSGGVTVGSDGLRVTLRGAGVAGRTIGGQDVFFHDVDRDMDAIDGPKLGGAELFAVLRSRLSPEQLRYRVALPSGAVLQTAEGGAVVSRAGVTLTRVLPPSARDAQGVSVPVRMRVVGDELLLEVAHRERDLAYPVMVDPEFVSITSSAENWKLHDSPICAKEATVNAVEPGMGKVMSITVPSRSYPYKWLNCNKGEEERHDGGTWSWENPKLAYDAIEFYGISHSVTETREDASQWTLTGCGQAYQQVEEIFLPPILVFENPNEPSACLSSITVSLLAGIYSVYTEPVTVSASLSVEGILLGSPWPIPEDHESEEYGPDNPGEPHHAKCTLGYPVNCATGDQTVAQTDLTVGGRGPGLDMTRTYNSQLAAKATEPGIFGYGWTGSYSAHIVFGKTGEGVSMATVHQDDGSTTLFEFFHEKWVPAAPLVQATLVQEGGTYVYTLPEQTKLDFEGAGRLTSETDRDGNVTTMNRNAEGRLASISDPVGRKLTLTYNANGQVESVKDPMGHIVKYVYEVGNLVSVTQPGEVALRWQFKYNTEHEMTSETDGREHAIVTEYDGSHRVIMQKDAMERERHWEYRGSAERSETVVTEPNGVITSEEFNNQGLPTVVIHQGSLHTTVTHYSYDASDDLVAVTDPDEHVTSYTYDAAGDRTSETDPLKHKTEWTYDSAHDVLTTTTPDGEKTTIKRESHGNPETVSRPAPGSTTQTTTYKYSSHGELESLEDPLKRVWKYGYDSKGDRTSETDPESNKRTWEYNEDSQETATVSPRGNAAGAEASKYTTKIEVDAQGRPLTVTDPLGHKTKYTYDGDGNLETLTDPNSNKTKYTYDADNERTKIEEPNKTITETGYDSAGQVVSQTDGNKNTTKYVRNELEEVVEVVDPRERKTTKEYDLAGNLTSLTDAVKRTTTYTYDAANRLKEISYSDGKTHAVKYEYNGDNKLTHMTDGTGETVNTYDELDRLTESQNGHKETSKYEYDLANEITKITYPNGKAITRTYDKDGRLEKVTDWSSHVTKFSYDPDSDLITTTFPSETKDEDKYVYNEADQMTEDKMLKSTESLASLVYTRDNDGQVKGITSKGLPGEEKPAYEYDTNNRLKKGGTIAYEYDAANNPTKIGTGTYAYNKADELETGPSLKYTYNEVGQRTKTTPTTGSATTYGDDQAGNLISVERPKEGEKAAISDTYAYNGSNLRTSQTVAGTTTYLTWDAAEELPLVLSDGTNSYIYGPGGLPVEQISSGGTVTYLHHDQAGSTRLLTGSTGTVTGKCTYGAYGAPTCEGATATPLGYDAQYTSSDTGLIYLRARTYDPATAQFLSVDPFESITGEPYSYVGDNPLNHFDPSGRCGVVCVGGIVLGGVALATGVGEVVGVTAGIVDLGYVSAAAGAAATGLDVKSCVGGSGAACVGAAVGAVASGGAAVVAGGLVAGEAANGVTAIGLTSGGISLLTDAASALVPSPVSTEGCG